MQEIRLNRDQLRFFKILLEEEPNLESVTFTRSEMGINDDCQDMVVQLECGQEVQFEWKSNLFFPK